MLAYIDPGNVDMRSRWIAVGAQDYVANAGIPERDLDFNAKRYTYLSVLRDETLNSQKFGDKSFKSEYMWKDSNDKAKNIPSEYCMVQGVRGKTR